MIAVLDSRIPSEALKALEERGFEPVLLPPHPALPAPVASHPDLLLFFTDSAFYTVDSYFRMAKDPLLRVERLTNMELRVCRGEIGGTYPRDVLLDAAPVGTHLFCFPAHTAEELTAHYGKGVIPVKQGYAKCSCVPVSSHAMITADRSIQKAAADTDVSCLLIREGDITLSGYSYGFVGGASSYCPRGTLNEIYFCGDLRTHPDGEIIKEFCRSNGKTAVSLGNFPLTDVGTMFLL